MRLSLKSTKENTSMTRQIERSFERTLWHSEESENYKKVKENSSHFQHVSKRVNIFFSGKTPHRSGQVQGSHGERFSTIGSSF